MRIKESTETGILVSVEQSSEVRNIFISFTKLVKYKLQKIVNFSVNNFLKMKEENHAQYQETSDFRKLLKISKEYTERYSKELGEYWREDFPPLTDMQLYWNLLDTKPTNCLMSVLKQRLESLLGNPNQSPSYLTAPFSHKRKLSQLSTD